MLQMWYLRLIYRISAYVFPLLTLASTGRTYATTSPRSSDPSLIVNRLQFDRGTAITSLEGSNEGFTFRTNDIQLRLTKDVFECLANFKFDGDIATDRVSSSGVNHWTLWKLDMFNPHDKQTWIPHEISNCGISKDYFLGGPCKLSEGHVQRFYSGIPEHKEIRITGRVHFFDRWNGEAVNLKVDKDVVWSHVYSWCPTVFDTSCTKYRIDVCGQEYPDLLSMHVDVTLPHSNDRMSIEFNSTIKGDSCEASWGIDDIAVFLR
ncbi:hypothetical protein BgAZ_201930 [Babesia gibsoni]|uniref:Uncharacterized protein n=1 Tax=Babesia gibsoni TaxID=33632 RepID=A0AAD8LKL1_BABGI|nr:hypothetical protein BgAZ_201930 [Babesia gibsoni]